MGGECGSVDETRLAMSCWLKLDDRYIGTDSFLSFCICLKFWHFSIIIVFKVFCLMFFFTSMSICILVCIFWYVSYAQVTWSDAIVSMVNMFFLKGLIQNQGFKHKRKNREPISGSRMHFLALESFLLWCTTNNDIKSFSSPISSVHLHALIFFLILTTLLM